MEDRLTIGVGRLLAPLLLFLTHCQVEVMPVAFIAANDGLKLEHQGKTPLLEKVNCPPGAAECEVMRVYPDGALYFQDRRNPATPVWSYLTQVRESGLSALQSTFDGLCGVDVEPARGAADEGSVTYRWETKKCAKEVVITGVSYGAFAPLADVATVVNSNLVPRTSGT